MTKDPQIQQRFADMWKRSRADSGMSQAEVAKRLGVSKTTVQNWEAGFSCPDQIEGFAWFRALGLPPMPYYLSVIYPDDCDAIRHDRSEENVTKMLIDMIKNLPFDKKKKLLFWLSGEHGSSPFSVLELVIAHLLTPLQSRISTAHTIAMNYTIAKKKGRLSSTRVHPNMEVLQKAIERATEATIGGNLGYNVTDIGNGDDHD